MDDIHELRNLLKSSLGQLEKHESVRIENILERIERKIGIHETKYNRAIQDRQAVHSLLKKTSDDLVLRYRTIFEHSGSPMVVIEKDGTIVLANTFFGTLIGKNVQDIEKKANITDYFAGGSCDPLLDESKGVGQDPITSETTSCRIHLPDGSFRDVMVSSGSFPGSTQRNITLLDVTERNRLERDLVDSENYLLTLKNSIQAGVLVIDATTHTIMDANPAALSMIGVTSRDDIIGKNCHRFVCPALEGQCPITDLGMRVDNAQRVLMTCDGTTIPIIKYVVPVTLKGQPHLLETFIDNSERKKAEAAIELANRKLNLMNNITRHDILNTITGIYGCVDMLRASGVETENDQLLADIKEQVRVIQRQITFTKEYQEVGIRMPQWQNVRAIIGKVISNFEKLPFSPLVEVGEFEIYADPLFEKVIYNLLDNAVRYAETAMQFTFSSRKSGKTLILICEDNGVGVPEDQKELIFKRGIGKNTGMGLFLTREILEITGISICETGVSGKGARFEIHIPPGGYPIQCSPRLDPDLPLFSTGSITIIIGF
jgi:PAS domain S-box-containing protein